MAQPCIYLPILAVLSLYAAAVATMSSSSSQTLYFGYGSNMWLHQMTLRCPTSTYMSIGRLPSYRWIINTRGYANVVPSSSCADEVYGLLYSLKPEDERALDRNEGVPAVYEKWELEVEVGKKGDVKRCLVYVDVGRTGEGKPKAEYVVRMNEAVTDAVEMSVPGAYVDGVIRKFIPEEGVGREGLRREAQAQAERFVD